MKILFDIMDEKGMGHVHYKDIERRWCEDEACLPNGVLDCLLKVTPPSGLLSFERFVAGLRICLLRSRAESQSKFPAPSSSPTYGEPPSSSPYTPPFVEVDVQGAVEGSMVSCVVSTQGEGILPPACPPSRCSSSTSSMFLPEAVSLSPPFDVKRGDTSHPPRLMFDQDQQAPPKPPRQLPSHTQPSRQQILCALQRWHRERVRPASFSGEDDVSSPHQTDSSALCTELAKTDGTDFPCSVALVSAAGRRAAAARNRRHDSRRHTLQSGVDSGLLRRVRHIEAEMVLMRRGLEAVDRARDWYCQRLAALTERMQSAGVMSRVGGSSLNTERSSDAAEERLGLLTARVQEVNQLLLTLVEPTRRGTLPLHINLAIQPIHTPTAPSSTPSNGGAGSGSTVSNGGAGSGSTVSNGGTGCGGGSGSVSIVAGSCNDDSDQSLQRAIHQLKLQNQRLTQEVADKSGRITSLESDKTKLIRQLFNARSELPINTGFRQHNLRTMDESTLM